MFYPWFRHPFFRDIFRLFFLFVDRRVLISLIALFGVIASFEEHFLKLKKALAIEGEKEANLSRLLNWNNTYLNCANSTLDNAVGHLTNLVVLLQQPHDFQEINVQNVHIIKSNTQPFSILL